jgi:hypothetical protein
VCLSERHAFLTVVSSELALVLVQHGYQDYEPITQAYRLAALLPRAEVCLINECGH